LSHVIKLFKGRSAAAVNQHLQRQGSLWQRGFHDHALRRDEDQQQVARYIIANPLRAGLVEKIGDYPLWDAIWL
jgi:REP element-mobilizing transposase RayT